MALSLYQFNSEDAFMFARYVGIETYQKGNELHFRTCPYCKGIGKKGHTNKKTFSINLDTGQHKCFICDKQGNMLTLVQDFSGFKVSNDNANEYYNPQKKYKKLTTPSEPVKAKSTALDYLKARGISEEVIQEYHITELTEEAITQYDLKTPTKANTDILVIPFFDEKEQVQFVKYRDTKHNERPQYAKEWCESQAKPILFGMAQCKDYERIIITEGQIDSLSLASAGIQNAVSVPTGKSGFSWVPYCWNFLRQFKEIIIFGDLETDEDTEEKHITLLDKLQREINRPIKHVRVEDYKDKKDANDLLQCYGADHLRQCIENAIFEPAEFLRDLADIEDQDEDETERLETNIHVLDKALKGGLPFGGITILTGKCGEGKSTLASQMIISAFDKNYKTFVYSGELQAKLFKSWIMRQIAGQDEIIIQSSKSGYMTPIVKREAKEKINTWLKGKCTIYDDSIIPSEADEMPALSKTIEEEAIKGTRVFLIDNLMTAIDLENLQPTSNEYESQGKYLKHLARLTRKYNILLILVAHKRKEASERNENDDISGSAYISNNATLILSYGKIPKRPKEKDESQEAYTLAMEENEAKRVLKVTKDRILGNANKTGYEMHFEPNSKRIYFTSADLNKVYTWKEWQTVNQETYDQYEIPF